MFVLETFKDEIEIKPYQFGSNLKQQIALIINKKFSNLVIYNVGLAMLLHDIINIEKNVIMTGSASCYCLVKFRLVIFRPAISEIITGRIYKSTKDGVYVTINFFQDILIRPEHCQQPYRFDDIEKLWVWEYSDDNSDEEAETQEKHDMFMELNQEIRLRVIDETFTKLNPSEIDKGVPYQLSGSINEYGLGLVSWWQNV
ncbi:RNA polymerase III subunit C8 [Intoshia linei]|uniref:RNA polymerase III subunit C8 n=1 Tax=Intoshia linei TaxID=1819745 RepID=A0A177B1G1_9BILA|nr:RNA polymerase III subunit C8 [Intoshia linei]